ncbi:MAG: hypothetical protein QGG00_11965, partial [Verrucomicrobiota bacterium]|nr:hypothetical protein [Verrucomicrobiota bacterium]
EIELPEAERQMGVCFCPECEELLDFKTANENTPEEPDPVDSEQVEEGEGAAPEEAEPVETEGEGSANEDDAEQDPATSQEQAAAEMEFWLDDVLAATVDCSKCANSLKLDDEEKMFGIYRCPYCKADINHAKGAVVEWLIPKLGDEEGEEEPAAKRKPINLKALLPYAAVLVFGVALNYGVIAVTGYIQEKKALKAQWVLQLKSDWVELEQQTKVFDRALSNASNKASIVRLEEMSMDELKEFHEHLLTERKDAYAIWFEDTARDDITADSKLGPVVEQFRRMLDRIMRRVQLAKIDADNLNTAIGMSSFERQRAVKLLEKHMAAIRNQMHGLSAEEAVDQALVRPELLADLMKFNMMVDQFEMQSIRQAVIHLNSMMQFANLIEKHYDLNLPPGSRADAEGQGGGHPASSDHEEEPVTHASHGDEHSEPSDHEEEPAAHASHGDEHSELSNHEEEPVAHAHGDDHADHSGQGHSSHAKVKPGTLWNAEVFHWEEHQTKRAQEHQPQWDKVVAEYGDLLDLFSGFHQELKALRDGAGISRLDHPFLDGAVLQLKVDEFRALEGVATLVSHDVVARLERLATLLDPYATGSLAYNLNAHKARRVKLTHEQAGQFYERFWEEWKKFHLEKQWFKLEGISAYYHLARYDSTSSAKVHH